MSGQLPAAVQGGCPMGRPVAGEPWAVGPGRGSGFGPRAGLGNWVVMPGALSLPPVMEGPSRSGSNCRGPVPNVTLRTSSVGAVTAWCLPAMPRVVSALVG